MLRILLAVGAVTWVAVGIAYLVGLLTSGSDVEDWLFGLGLFTTLGGLWVGTRIGFAILSFSVGVAGGMLVLAIFAVSEVGAGWVLAGGLVPIVLLGVYGYWITR